MRITPPGGGRQFLLNLLGYVLFVVVSYGVVVSHACLLKCTPMEAALEIFTKALLPLWIFRSRSFRGIIGRVILCWIIGAILFEAYGRWLHSDSFPRAWLDVRAQEWVCKQEELSQKLYDNGSAFPSPN